MPEEAKPLFEDRSRFAPLVLFEYEHNPGRFCLMMTDGDMEQVEDVFEDLNAEGNGHGWEGLAESVGEAQMSEIADRLTFGSEAGTFVVESHDLSALQRLGALLHDAFHDRPLLADLISKANPTYLPR